MPNARLCVTVTAPTMAELRKRRDAIADADLVELRIDSVRDPDAAAALDGRRGPVIVTCRPTWEGGFFTGSEEVRQRLLQEARRLGAEYVDVEWKADFRDALIQGNGRGVIVSSHDFSGVPIDLDTQYDAMRETGAEVVKIAVTAARLADCLPLADVAAEADRDLVLLAMGDAGVVTRILPSRFGSAWTYAGDAVAPGQMPASRLRDEFGFDRAGAATAIYGIIGRPVMHSLSPAMHNAAFRAAGIDAVYVPLAAADFDDFERFAAAMHVEGASVTAPFKLDAFTHAADVDDVGRRVGSVNTLRRTSRGWSACNTDGAGFLAPLEQCGGARGLRATILGAGGAARGVADALHAAGADVSIAARLRPRAVAVAGVVGAAVADWPPAADTWDLLVNATPVGTHGKDTEPLPPLAFRGSAQLVYDLVYNPPETPLLADARAAGCRTIGGLDMLVAQAERQFAWWTGTSPRPGVMRDAAHAALGRRHTDIANRV